MAAGAWEPGDKSNGMKATTKTTRGTGSLVTPVTLRSKPLDHAFEGCNTSFVPAILPGTLAGVESPVRIRPACVPDLQAIAAFNLQLAWETEHLQLDPAIVRAGVEAVLSDPQKGIYFVAEAGGRVIGQCSVTYEWSDWRNGMFWWLQSVFVERAWRKQGVLRSLFRHVESAAVQCGAVGLRLYVEEDNEGARNAYRCLNMNPTSYRVLERPLPRLGGPRARDRSTP